MSATPSKKPPRMGRLSLAPLSLEQALRGAMMAKPPEVEPKAPRSKKPRPVKATKKPK